MVENLFAVIYWSLNKGDGVYEPSCLGKCKASTLYERNLLSSWLLECFLWFSISFSGLDVQSTLRTFLMYPVYRSLLAAFVQTCVNFLWSLLTKWKSSPKLDKFLWLPFPWKRLNHTYLSNFFRQLFVKSPSKTETILTDACWFLFGKISMFQKCISWLNVNSKDQLSSTPFLTPSERSLF